MRSSAVAAAIFVLIACDPSGTAHAQDALDRIHPTERNPREASSDDAHSTLSAPLQVVNTVQPVGNERPILVGAVTFRGLQELEPNDFADVIASYVGQVLDQQELSSLANAIADRARSRGYAFAAAWIEPQQIAAGVLSVRVDEGRIDEIRFDGPRHASVHASLAPLVSGKPTKLSEVERRILLADDIAGVRVRSSRFIREGDRGILLVRTEINQFTGRVTLSNDGTQLVGPEQMLIEADLNGLIASDDSLSLAYSTTPAQPRELQFARVRYSQRVNDHGTELALTGSTSHARPGAYLSDLNLHSRSWLIAGSVRQPLWRRRHIGLWLQGELELRDLAQQRDDLLVRHDRTIIARITVYGHGKTGGGQLRTSLTLSQGLDIFGATGAVDPLASRQHAEADFKTLHAWADWTKNLGGPVSLQLAIEGQLASGPLLISEELGLGGSSFLRGYSWSERSGDEGAVGLAEVRYDWKRSTGVLSRAQVYGFVDAGHVSNIGSDFGDGSLASAGGGVRADISGQIGANLEIAMPLTGPRYATGDESAKVNIRFLKSF
jgi:hemolysin activation/secretion protein